MRKWARNFKTLLVNGISLVWRPATLARLTVIENFRSKYPRILVAWLRELVHGHVEHLLANNIAAWVFLYPVHFGQIHVGNFDVACRDILSCYHLSYGVSQTTNLGNLI